MTKDKCLLCLVAVLFFLSGCVSAGFNTNNFDNSTRGAKYYQSAGKPWSISHEDKITRRGIGSVRFELRPDDTWWDTFKQSHRTEMRFNETYGGWYGFSMFIPDDGAYTGSKTYIGQWHAVGEGSSVRGKAVHPAISQCFIGVNDSNVLSIQVHGDSGLQYIKIIDNFPRGEWVDFVYQIKFSSGQKGNLNAWMNGKQIVSYKGPNTYRGAVHMFKFGIYTMRAHEMNKPLVVYFDEYTNSSAYESVDPSKGETPRIDM